MTRFFVVFTASMVLLLVCACQGQKEPRTIGQSDTSQTDSEFGATKETEADTATTRDTAFVVSPEPDEETDATKETASVLDTDIGTDTDANGDSENSHTGIDTSSNTDPVLPDSDIPTETGGDTDSSISSDTVVSSDPILDTSVERDSDTVRDTDDARDSANTDTDSGTSVATTDCGAFDPDLYLCDSRDSTLYRYVTIGSKVWMAQNLNFGVMMTGADDQENGYKYCYDDDESECDVFGGLYQWHVAVGLPLACASSSCEDQLQNDVQGVCPLGWHIPSKEEWSDLVDVAESINEETAYVLKSSDDVWATNPSTGLGGPGTDDLGFTALAGGGRYTTGYKCAGNALETGDYFCWGRKFRGMFWTKTESSSNEEAYFYDVSDDQSNVTRMDDSKRYGFSVRCIRNE